MGFPLKIAPDFFLRWNARIIILNDIFFIYLLITALFGNKRIVFETFTQQSTFFLQINLHESDYKVDI